MWAREPYAIVEADRFLLEAAEFAESIRRWDEIRDTLLQHLPYTPHEAGYPVRGTPYYALTILSDPLLTVYYSVDDDHRTLTFESIQIV